MPRTLILIALLALMVGSFVFYRANQGTSVNAYTVKQLPLEQWVVASGQVRYEALARIGSEVTGRIAERLAHEGDVVAAGQPLLLLHKEDLQAQYEQAETALQQLTNFRYPQAVEALTEARLVVAQSEREANRRAELAARGMLPTEQSEQAQRLLKSHRSALSQAELQVKALAPKGDEERLLQQRLATAKANLAKAEIRAPFAGRLQTREVETGDLVQPGKVLFELARVDGLEVVAAVDEKYIAPLAVGQPVTVIADAWPERLIEGTLSFVAPAVDDSSGTVDVHVKLQGDTSFLRLGMTVSVNVLTDSKAKALVVPKDFVSQRGQQTIVYKAVHDYPQRVAVRRGLASATEVELTEGVAAGDVLLLPSHIDNEQQKIRPLLEGPH